MSDDLDGVPIGDILQHTCDHIPGRFWLSRFVDFDPSVSPAAKRGLAAIEQLVAGSIQGGLISGPTGCGKSFLAAIACVELSMPAAQKLRAISGVGLSEAEWDRQFTRIYADCPRWVNVPVVLEQLRRGFDQMDRAAIVSVEDLEADTRAPALVVLDDLGAEKPSEWTADVLYRLVSERYDSGRRTLATSNLTAAQLSRRPGYGRIVSRLAEDGMLLELASGKDYRLTKRRRTA